MLSSNGKITKKVFNFFEYKISLFYFLISSILILSIPLKLSSQWITQYPENPGIGLRDIRFINKNTGWICGDGIILKTTNKGINWIEQNHPATDKLLFTIFPVDSNIVYCVGYFDTFLKTTNGGNNWTALQNGLLGYGNSFRGAYFLNDKIGFWGGYRLLIFKTTDGGLTFDSTYMPGTINDIHFKDMNTGLVVCNGGIIFKTTNQGLNWNRIYMIPNNYGDFNKISVIENKYCFVVEDAKRVYKSTNYGDTWDSIGFVTGADHPYSCRFSSLQTGWVCGTYGQIFKSTDGGASWYNQNVNVTNLGWLGCFWFHSDSVGWAIGGNTKLLYTSTGGTTFVSSSINNIPENFELKQNYPNPFNNQTVVKYYLKKKGFVNITIYDVQGRKISELLNSEKSIGEHEIKISSQTMASGIYFLKLTIDNINSKTIKIVLKK